MIKLVRKITFILVTSLIAAGFLFGSFSSVRAESAQNNPTTSLQSPSLNLLQTLDSFAASIKNGRSSQLVGVYAPSAFSYPVVQQPGNNAAFVSTLADVVTQFGLASQYGATGLLAHNTLAGSTFANLSVGDVVSLIYGDGSIKLFKIDQIQSYQALNPYSPYSNFIDLSNPDQQYTSTDLFYRTYGLGNVLVLQTCIARNGNDSWGRLFIIASPVDGNLADYYSSYSQGKVTGSLNFNGNTMGANY